MCPHHNLEKSVLVHKFHNSLNYNTCLIIDADSCEALMNKGIDGALVLIENMTLNHNQ